MAEHVVYNEDGVPVVIYASNAELEIIEEENIDGYPVQQNIEDGDTSEYQISIPHGYVKPEGTIVIDGSGTHDVAEYAAASVPAGSAAVPSTAITANPVLTIDDETGEISAVVSASQSIAPSVTEGWVESGTAGTVTVSGSASQQLTVRGDEDLGIGITDEIIPGPIRPIKQTHVNVAAPPGYYPDGAYNFDAVDEATFDVPYDVTISPVTGAASIGFSPATHGVVYESNSYTMTKANVVTVEQGGTITPTTSEQTVMNTGPRYIVNPLKVGAIPSQYIIPTGTKQINSAGTFDVTEYAEAQVTMPSPSLQTKSATPTETAQTVTADQGYDGLGQVNVGAIDSEYVGSDVPRYDYLVVGFIDQELLGRKQKSLRVTATPGYYEDSPYYSASEATFSVAKGVSIDSSGDATITFSPATHGVAYEVETYTVTKTGAVTPRTSSDLSASGAAIQVPAGYYAAAASKSVASGSASTPATSITANPSISVSSSGLITATASASQSVTPSVSAGWVSSGTSGTVTVSGSNTSQLSTQGAATITPTTSQQTAVASGKFTTGAVLVDPIPSEYIIPSGTKSITANGTGIDVSQYASVDVSVSSGGGDMVQYIYWTGSGADKTSIGINAKNHNVYFTLPFDSSSSYIVSGATADTNGVKARDVYLYSDENMTQSVGYYRIDQGEISQTYRTTANSPWLKLDTEYLVVPKGYFAKIVLSRSGSALFSSNGNMNNYLLAKGVKITLKAV